MLGGYAKYINRYKDRVSMSNHLGSVTLPLLRFSINPKSEHWSVVTSSQCSRPSKRDLYNGQISSYRMHTAI